MRNFHRSAGISGLLVLASIVMIAGCNNPTPVEPSYQAPTFSTQEDPCPTIEEICTSIVDQVESLCPRPDRNWGQENSCRKALVAQLLDSHKDCLTGNQMSDVRDCVVEKLGLGNAGDRKGPDPHQS